VWLLLGTSSSRIYNIYIYIYVCIYICDYKGFLGVVSLKWTPCQTAVWMAFRDILVSAVARYMLLLNAIITYLPDCSVNGVCAAQCPPLIFFFMRIMHCLFVNASIWCLWLHAYDYSLRHAYTITAPSSRVVIVLWHGSCWFLSSGLLLYCSSILCCKQPIDSPASGWGVLFLALSSTCRRCLQVFCALKHTRQEFYLIYSYFVLLLCCDLPSLIRVYEVRGWGLRAERLGEYRPRRRHPRLHRTVQPISGVLAAWKTRLVVPKFLKIHIPRTVARENLDSESGWSNSLPSSFA